MTQAFCLDCLEAMRSMPDNAFDIAVCDPVYGDNGRGGWNRNPHSADRLAKALDYPVNIWNQSKTNSDCFAEIFRVSRNQIIWGGNYFTTSINRDSQCWLVWDKDNGTNCFADCELAWTSFDSPVRLFRFRWAGMRQQDMKHKEIRIHPTQKPVALYRWIFQKYANPGDKILDPFLGSGSSRIAAYDAGLDFTGYEIDPEYFRLQEERYAAHAAQLSLFVQA